MPGRSKSSVYRAWPVTSRGSSRRLIAEPKILGAISSAFHPRGGFAHRRDDVVVAGAAAEVAFDPMTDVRFARIRIPFQEIARGEDHPRRAEAALKSVLV